MKYWHGVAALLARRWQVPLAACALILAGATLYRMKPTQQEVPFDGISLKPFLEGGTDKTKPLILGFISTSQLVRSKDHLLEVYTPFLGMPEGRFYYTGKNRFWKGYERADKNPEHAAAKKQFLAFLDQYPAVLESDPFWETRSGKKFHKAYTDPQAVEKHLFNHKDYKFYDEE